MSDIAGISSHANLSSCTFVDNIAFSGSNVYLGDSSRVSLINSIVTFGEIGEGIVCTDGSEATIACSDVFGNQGGDWVGCISSQQGENGNLWADPLFCSREYHMYELDTASPCAEENNPGCGLIGALPAGCDFTNVAGGIPESKVFRLEPNVPNPFNPTTMIRFQLAEPGEVDLVIYGASGRLVASVASGNHKAGPHAVTWDGRDDLGHTVPSGIYFARLQAGDFTATRKMVLLR